MHRWQGVYSGILRLSRRYSLGLRRGLPGPAERSDELWQLRTALPARTPVLRSGMRRPRQEPDELWQLLHDVRPDGVLLFERVRRPSDIRGELRYLRPRVCPRRRML
jgi:hypothetical protein